MVEETTVEAPVVLTVREVASLLRVQRPKVYDLLREGTLRGFKIGSDWRITRESVEGLVGQIPLSFFLSPNSSLHTRRQL